MSMILAADVAFTVKLPKLLEIRDAMRRVSEQVNAHSEVILKEDEQAWDALYADLNTVLGFVEGVSR